MQLVRPKTIPVPIPFILMVVMALAVFIYFGAWAVSADQGQLEQALSMGFGPNASLPPDAPGAQGAQPSATNLPNGQVKTAADTWWGKGVLYVCPFH